MAHRLAHLFVSNEDEEQGTISVPNVQEVSANIGTQVDADTSKTGETQADVVILPEPGSVVPTPKEVEEIEGAVAALEHHAAIISSIVDRNETISGPLAKAIKVSTAHFPRRIFNGYQPIASLEDFFSPITRMSPTLEAHSVLLTGIANLKRSLESQEGAAHEVDVKKVDSTLPKPGPQNADNETKGEIAETPDTVEAGFDDLSVDDEARKQGEEIHKRLERLSDTASAVEAYLDILRVEISAERYVGKDVASVIRKDLQTRYPVFFKGIAPTLEDFNTSLYVSLELSDELTDKAKGIGNATKTALAKFWAWVKEMFNKMLAFLKKLFGIVDKEERKTVYLLKVADVIPEPGESFSATPKPLPPAPADVTSKAAEVVITVIAEAEEEKYVAPKELPVTIKVAGSELLESVEDDPWGMGSRETGGLTHLYDAYTNLMWRAGREIEKDTVTVADADKFDKLVESLAKYPTTAIFAGNKQFKYKEGTATLQLVDSDQTGGKSYAEMKLLDIADIKKYLEKNQVLLENIKWVGESWTTTAKMLSNLDKRINKTENEEVKAIITKRITEFLDADIDKFFKHCAAVAAKRNQILDHMLAIHAECAGRGKPK